MQSIAAGKILIIMDKKKKLKDWPRRHSLDLNTPAELAIRKAMIEVEKLTADGRLTEAVVLLEKAKTLVSDYVDNTQPESGESGAWLMNEINKNRPTHEQLKEAAAPLIRLLNGHFHPHASAIVTPTSVEIVEGVMVLNEIHDFIND